MKLKLLFVEDSEDDVRLVVHELERAGYAIAWQCVDTEPEFRVALSSEPWDMIVSDYSMPEFTGSRAFEIYKELKLDIPFIFVSGALGEDRAVEAMRRGARDYFVKGKLGRLGAAVSREIEESGNRRARREGDRLRYQEQRRLALALEATGAGIFEIALPLDHDYYVSPRLRELLGEELSEAIGSSAMVDRLMERIHPGEVSTAIARFRAFADGRVERLRHQLSIRRTAGEYSVLDVLAMADHRAPDGTARHIVGVVIDATEQRQLEAQLWQAQKMEAVGRLAGGVAHDFNNILTAIISFARFARDSVDPGSQARDDLEEVLRAADRAAGLTRQLLAFSRRQTVTPSVLDVNALITELQKMLHRLLGEDVEVRTSFADDVGRIYIDRGAFEQVLVNLAVNARDAMPSGGTLTLETRNVVLDADYARAHGATVPAGEYVMIAVADTGLGMTEETQRQLFEPFFTTKEPGKGTGLGLSTCYGIVKQANGFIWVYSELGRGSTFKIYLPRADQRETAPGHQEGVRPSHTGSETVLVVEDNDQVRSLASRILSSRGYRVLSASSGDEAMAACRTMKGRIHLMLTDVVMPRMSGRELVEAVRLLQPEVRVLFMSGYTPTNIVEQGLLEAGTELLEKPFSPDALLQRVREVLSKPA